MFPSEGVFSNLINSFTVYRKHISLAMNNKPDKFTGIFNFPGEGFLAQINVDGTSTLFDIKGLQYLILNRKKIGKKTESLELALRRIRSLENQSLS
jgi:hypothetical protein